MRIRIKAPFSGAQSSGIFGANGKEIAIGTEFTVEEEPVVWAGRYDIISGAADTSEKVAVTNPASTDETATDQTDDSKSTATGPQGPFTVGEGKGGWFPILDAKGEKVKSLREDDAKAFQTLTPEDQVAFLAE